MLLNPSFEGGWTDLPAGNTLNQQPNGWTLTWKAVNALVESVNEFPDDEAPVFEVVKTIPECVHKHKSQLPPDEQPGAPHALILDGDYAYKVFAAFNPFSAKLSQTIHNVHGPVLFEVPVQVHHHGDGSFGACAFQLRVNEASSDWLTFHGGLTEFAWEYPALEYTADGDVTVEIVMESRALAGIDFFIDYLFVEVDPIDPEPVVCPGQPREDYARTYNVIPADATEERAVVIFLEGWRRSRETAGGSYDDAGIGDLSSKTARLYDIPAAQHQAYADFYAEWYPGVNVEFVDGDPDPDPDGEPTPYPLRSANHIGLHSGFPRAQSWPYIESSGTNIQKFFSAGDAYQAGTRAPGIVSIWRKFVGDPGITDPIATQAQWLVDQYTAEINTASAALGVTVEQLLSKITAVESLNETIPTFSPTVLQRAVEFDCRFAEKLHSRYGSLIAPVLLNVAIGNPHESEVVNLLPAAQASVQYGGFLGYHAYWTRNEQQGFISDYWQWHAGRWMEWDAIFRDNGVYPRYALGEGGIVYAPDGVSFNSGKGWKSCGSFELYLDDIQEFNARVTAWNAQHANRCAGLTLFGYGNWGWDNFELGDGEVALLNNWAQGAK